MADIIRLDDRRSKTTRRARGQDAPAQILLFTGVRYERMEPLSKRPAPSKRLAASKRLANGPKRSRNRAAKRAEG